MAALFLLAWWLFREAMHFIVFIFITQSKFHVMQVQIKLLLLLLLIITHPVLKAYVVVFLLPTPFITSRLALSLDGCYYNKSDAAEGRVVSSISLQHRSSILKFFCLFAVTNSKFKRPNQIKALARQQSTLRSTKNR